MYVRMFAGQRNGCHWRHCLDVVLPSSHNVCTCTLCIHVHVVESVLDHGSQQEDHIRARYG